jgi:hypothetical protein
MTESIPDRLTPSVDIPYAFDVALPHRKLLGKAIWPGIELCSNAGSRVGITEASESFGKAAAAAHAEVFARKLRRSMVRRSPKMVPRRKSQGGEGADLLRFLPKWRGENVVFCGETYGKCGPKDGVFGS